MEIEDLKDFLTTSVRLYYDERIQRDYNLQKQINVSLTVETGLATMTTFISGMITERDALITEIDKLASTDILTSFAKSSDSAMESYVGGYLTLTSDDQEKAITEALRKLQ